ncbi:MAG: gamma-glutamyl-gamma-aminobutyrate hydrolase family protein [Planctomycetes bacterium]|nr:gamma-glutamyl-gamma-aminobutyrate hydrolase family protein [Planctomycetota bacterium]
MKTRPLIAVNTDLREEDKGPTLYLRMRYVQALWAAGARPVLLPPMEGVELAPLLAGFSGLLLTGGDDLDPALYGGTQRHEKEVPLHPLRERFDLELVRTAVAMDLPTLAICLGLKELCVAFGGKITPYIPDDHPGALEHGSLPGETSFHPLIIAPRTRLASLLAEGTVVNSSHRQAVCDPGEGLKVAARTTDRVIEAVEGRGEAFLLGVQWHPDLLPDDPQQAGLFKALVKAAAAYAATVNPDISSSSTAAPEVAS